MQLNTIADALSGLQDNQEYMNVIGNNIANVNTTGYKSQSIRFEDLLNQTISYGSAANAPLQGTNPLQFGLGAGQGAINLINTQGSVQDTGRLTDMAIQGGGYFVTSNGAQNFYTRDGSFSVSPDGTLENAATGQSVMGWTSVLANGSVDTTTPLNALKIPLNSQFAAATTTVTMAGNLDTTQGVYVPASAGPPPVAASGGSFQTPITIYDSQGQSHQLTLTLQKTATDTWSYAVAAPGGATTDITSVTGGTGSLTFDSTGALTAPTTMPSLTINYAAAVGSSTATAPQTVTLDISKVSQLAEASQVNTANVDGTPGGTIATFTVSNAGLITAVYSNGSSRSIGQMALADFRNPDGLLREGNNLYTPGVNSGAPQYGQPGIGSLGKINTGQLEGSNVDLAAQFAEMIQAQQGFNANTKVVTTTNQMLQSIIGIIP